MPNNYFRFKRFTVCQNGNVFRVGTDGVLLGAVAELPQTGRVLDAGTGTGLIALMVAQRSFCRIIGIDHDPDSFLQASENFRQSEWSDRLQAENITLSEFAVREPGDSFECIISNPPYFRASLKSVREPVSRSRHSEYMSAVELLEASSKLLKQDGSLQVILPYREGTIFIAEASDYALYCNRIIKIRSKPGTEIKRLILKFEREKKQLAEKYITISTGKGYSEDYISLTRDFYLDF